MSEQTVRVRIEEDERYPTTYAFEVQPSVAVGHAVCDLPKDLFDRLQAAHQELGEAENAVMAEWKQQVPHYEWRRG